MQYEKCYTENTVFAYVRDGRSLLDFLVQHYGGEELSLESLTHRDVRAWLAYRSKTGHSARSNTRALSAVRTFYLFLKQRFQIETNVLSLIKKPKTPALLPHPLERKILQRLLSGEISFSHEPAWIQKRDQALFVLLYATGMRISEAMHLTWSMLKAPTTISIVGKGNKERLVPLLPIVKQRIQEYAAVCPYTPDPTKALFLNLHGDPLSAPHVSNRLRKVRSFYGWPTYMTAHAFRHSFASHLLEEGADLRSVQELLGHASLASTQIYTDVADQKILRLYRHTHPLEKSTAVSIPKKE
jgi:integrase/recombinase XerC